MNTPSNTLQRAMRAAPVVLLLGCGECALAGPADAARSAVQSQIQSVRNSIWYRTRRAEESDVAYCTRRFRSYDPRSGTYVAYDGRRRRCP